MGHLKCLNVIASDQVPYNQMLHELFLRLTLIFFILLNWWFDILYFNNTVSKILWGHCIYLFGYFQYLIEIEAYCYFSTVVFNKPHDFSIIDLCSTDSVEAVMHWNLIWAKMTMIRKNGIYNIHIAKGTISTLGYRENRF